MEDIDKTLRGHGLKKTAFRIELLNLFFDSHSSLTVEEIKKKAKTTKDKVTIYRALDAFEKSGLIHRVPDKANLTRYALCHTDCNNDKHIHNHAHFICTHCDETYCIDDIKIPTIKNAKGFNIKASNLTLEGECPECISNQTE